MKLEEPVNQIRSKIETAFNKRLAQFGLLKDNRSEIEQVQPEFQAERRRFEDILTNLISETDVYNKAREKLLDELTFTLFNRIAGMEVMEALDLHHPVFQRNVGNLSFGQQLWLEKNPENTGSPRNGLTEYIRYEFDQIGIEINLFASTYLYDLLPDVHDLDEIITEFNRIEKDQWQSDDIMGWLYESYNKSRLKAFKEKGDKIEWDKVSLNSQVYTPRWVVKFLVDNSLGKLLLEMYPESSLRHKIQVANAPTERTREPKKLEELKIIDPACGSGNFLLYAFDLFYEMYREQSYNEAEIPKLIIENNLHGIDLDDRAIQIAQLGLFIKAKRKNPTIQIEHFNVVSTDFYLPEYANVRDFFEGNLYLDKKVVLLIEDLWNDLRQAHRFGSLLNIADKVNVDIVKMTTDDLPLIREPIVKLYENYKPKLFSQFKEAVQKYTNGKARTFLKSKTVDGITFLEIMSQKYDVAVANPPYTDSGNYGPELKEFVQKYYKKPFNFSSNLYSCFIKVCSNLTNDDGKIALIHPHTFMFIKTFEDARKFIINHFHIHVFVDFGLDRVNLFGPGILLDAVFYVFEKTAIKSDSLFFSVTFDLQEKYKKGELLKAFDDYLNDRPNNRVYLLDQSKLKTIESWPFIYWISDGFREKFISEPLEKIAKVAYGVKTGNNSGALRFWWEVDRKEIFSRECRSKKWVQYTKGGPFRKWYGNNWLCVNWENDAEYIKRQNSSSLPPKGYSFKEGVSYPDCGSKGICFRYISEDMLYDKGASAIYPKIDLLYVIAALNSKLIFYIVDCLNPTVSKMPNDIKRIPFPAPSKMNITFIHPLSDRNIQIRRFLGKYSLIEFHNQISPLCHFYVEKISYRIITFFDYENFLLTQVLLNETIIDEKIFEVYELSAADRAMVLAKEGLPVGSLPVLTEARDAYLNAPEYQDAQFEFPLSEDVREYIRNLPIADLSDEEARKIKADFVSLYQKNNDLEEFCIRHQQNPITVWYLFREAHVLPSQRSREIVMELFADLIREILYEDEDGIAPLVEFSGEKTVQNRLYDKLIEKGFSNIQIGEFKEILGCEIDQYLEKHFFKELSDRLNLFMYLPKTPFIWHLTSGEYRGIEVFTLIYKWSGDKLAKLKSIYSEKRKAALKNRLIDISNDTSLPAQREKDTLQHQIQEIDVFQKKIDEILKTGYNPVLDDGVGKNIAPLQKAGLLKVGVLKEPQELNKYLNADW